ncbi:MAG: C1 family peptidase [Solirubrobacterales bacterium]
MPIPVKKLGLLPSPMDARDYRLHHITSVKRVFPAQYINPNLIPEPYDQGESEACVAYSLKAVKEMQEYRERGKFTAFSAAYIYGARAPNDYQGEGMVPRQALKELRKRGDCRDELFPGIYPYPECARKITPLMDQDAAPQRIKTFAALQTVDEIKTALLELGPVTIGIPVYDSFYHGGHLPKPDTGKETLHGYHMLTIIGWLKTNRWYVLNSWGSGWGELKGYCTMPYDYPIHEMWSVTDLAAAHRPGYEIALNQSVRNGRWTASFTETFRTLADVQAHLIEPLRSDLAHSGKEIHIRKR